MKLLAQHCVLAMQDRKPLARLPTVPSSLKGQVDATIQRLEEDADNKEKYEDLLKATNVFRLFLHTHTHTHTHTPALQFNQASG